MNVAAKLAQLAPPPSTVWPGRPALADPDASSAGCVSVSDGNWLQLYTAGPTKETFDGYAISHWIDL